MRERKKERNGNIGGKRAREEEEEVIEKKRKIEKGKAVVGIKEKNGKEKSKGSHKGKNIKLDGENAQTVIVQEGNGAWDKESKGKIAHE